MNEVIKRIRSSIISGGGSELKAVANDEGLKVLFAEKQRLLSEMSKVKKEAAEKAAEPYLELIKEIDEQYAMLLQLIANNSW